MVTPLFIAPRWLHRLAIMICVVAMAGFGAGVPINPAVLVQAAAPLPPLAPSLGPSPAPMAQSWVAGFALSGHIFRPGDTITGQVTVKAAKCFSISPCYLSAGWPITHCNPKALTCSWKAGEATNTWQVISVGIGNVVGPANSDDFLAIVGPTTHILNGFVRDTQGKGMPGVTILIEGAHSYRAITDAGGYYNALVPKGTYTVSAQPDGAFVPHATEVQVTDRASADFVSTVCSLTKSTAALPERQLALVNQGPAAMVNAGKGTDVGQSVGPGPRQVAVAATGTEKLPAPHPAFSLPAHGMPASLAHAPQKEGSRARYRARSQANLQSSSRAGNPGGSAACRARLHVQATRTPLGLSYEITVTNIGTATLQGLVLQQRLFPGYNVARPTDLSAGGTVTSDAASAAPSGQAPSWTVTWKQARLAPKAVWTLHATVTQQQVVARTGQIISGINTAHWTVDGWKTTATQHPPTITPNHDNLLYSDAPEFIAATTPLGAVTPPTSTITFGAAIEGVLYRQASPSATPFRLYLNHENRTAQTKSIYFVVANTPGAAAHLTLHGYGVDQKMNDPVKAGQIALVSYLEHRHAAKPFATLAPGASRAFFVATLSRCGDVVNALYDFTVDHPVQVAVVAVDGTGKAPTGGASGKHGVSFVDSPAAYSFNGVSARTVWNDAPLGKNPFSERCDGTHTAFHDARGNVLPEEPHVRGTYAYNDLTVTLPSYAADQATRYGWTFGGAPPSAEYQPAIDNGGEINKGNYGVLYHIELPVQASHTSALTQVLLNPRAGAYSGPIVIGTGQPQSLPAQGNVKDSNDAIGVRAVKAQVAGDAPFSFAVMPPGGSSLPVAVVEGPAYEQSDAQLSWPQATTPLTDTKVITLLPH